MDGLEISDHSKAVSKSKTQVGIVLQLESKQATCLIMDYSLEFEVQVGSEKVKNQ